MTTYDKSILSLSDYYGFHFNVVCEDLPGDKMNELRGVALALCVSYNKDYTDVFAELKRNIDAVIKYEARPL